MWMVPLHPTPTLFSCMGYHLVLVVLTQAVRDMQDLQLANEITFLKRQRGSARDRVLHNAPGTSVSAMKRHLFDTMCM